MPKSTLIPTQYDLCRMPAGTVAWYPVKSGNKALRDFMRHFSSAAFYTEAKVAQKKYIAIESGGDNLEAQILVKVTVLKQGRAEGLRKRKKKINK